MYNDTDSTSTYTNDRVRDDVISLSVSGREKSDVTEAKSMCELQMSCPFVNEMQIPHFTGRMEVTVRNTNVK